MPTLRPRLLSLGLAALLGTHAAFAAETQPKQPEQPPLSKQTQRSGGQMPAEQQRLNFDHAELHFAVDIPKETLDATARLTFTAREATDVLLLDLDPELKIGGIALDGKALPTSAWSNPDGRLQIQSGIGNLGTHSMFDVHRVAADMIGVPFEQCDIVFGNTSKNLPWTCISAGSQTAHAMTRAAHATATDAIKKLQEIAAKTRGGNPAAYKVAGGKVSGPGGSMTLAEAAKKAIELGGKYDGHELPEDINNFTKTSAKNLVGQGLMAVAKDAYPRDGQSQSYVVGFAEVEVDTETGVVVVTDYTAMGDVGTILNPRSLKGQLFGGSMLGLGHAKTQRWAYDQHYGVALARRFYQNKPPTILDAPLNFSGDAVNIPDPETPTGVRGVGEPPVGAAWGAIMNAIADAVGDEVFRRSPVTPDIILNALENGGTRTHEALTAHI